MWQRTIEAVPSKPEKTAPATDTHKKTRRSGLKGRQQIVTPAWQ
jgi:hypothetical protein